MKYLLETASLRTSRPFFNFFYRRFLFRRKSLFFKILSAYLLPFTLFYLASIFLKRLFTTPEKFGFSVISAGNIVSGGTGKTPMVMGMVKTLREKGRRIAVLSSGAAPSSRTADEIRMMGRNFPGLYLASKNPAEIKKLEEKMNRPGDTAVIDDGFHSRRIYRDADILLLDMSNPFDNKRVIPSGMLREPLGSLKRADVFVLTHPYMAGEKERKTLVSYLDRFKRPVFVMDYEIECLKNSEIEIPASSVCGKRIIAAAGIGNPMNFFHLLFKLSPDRIYAAAYPDHFNYRDFDIAELTGLFMRKKTDYIVATEKDYVKLEGKFPEGIPLFYLKINAVLTDLSGGKKGFDALFP